MNNATQLHPIDDRPEPSASSADTRRRRRCLGYRLAGLMRQLRERKVCRAAAAYAILSWVILQLGEIVFPALGLPDWTLTLIVLVAVGFFPVAMVLAWVLQWTENGLVVDVPVGGNTSGHSRVETILNVALLLAAIVLAAELVIAETSTGIRIAGSPATESSAPRIAILPFTAAGTEVDVRLFERLLRHELVIEREHGLQVVAAVSAQAADADPALNWLIDGAIYDVGGQLRLVLQLIELPHRRYVGSWTLAVESDGDVLDKLPRTAAATIIGDLTGRGSPY